MECLHGKDSTIDTRQILHLLELLFANAVDSEVQKLCNELCCGCRINHPSQRQHDCLMMDEYERWEMYGLDAIERVNEKRVVWQEFVEATRILNIELHKDVIEHLQQMEKDPDSMFVESLRELYFNTENQQLLSILNDLSHWKRNPDDDPLESFAETLFSFPPSYTYFVKGKGEKFRSYETDHKKAYEQYLENRLIEHFRK